MPDFVSAKKVEHGQSVQEPNALTYGFHLLLAAPPVQRPDERFHSDITHIPTQEGWLFTTATLDGFSRRCAGNNMEASLMLRSAVRARAPGDTSLRFPHSDQGRQ